jgi:hypothetical protein
MYIAILSGYVFSATMSEQADVHPAQRVFCACFTLASNALTLYNACLAACARCTIARYTVTGLKQTVHCELGLPDK